MDWIWLFKDCAYRLRLAYSPDPSHPQLVWLFFCTECHQRGTALTVAFLIDHHEGNWSISSDSDEFEDDEYYPCAWCGREWASWQSRRPCIHCGLGWMCRTCCSPAAHGCAGTRPRWNHLDISGPPAWGQRPYGRAHCPDGMRRPAGPGPPLGQPPPAWSGTPALPGSSGSGGRAGQRPPAQPTPAESCAQDVREHARGVQERQTWERGLRGSAWWSQEDLDAALVQD